MAADTKTYQAQFRISAVWAGQPGVQKAQRALGGLQRTAKAATTHFRGMTASVFKGMAAYGVASKAAAAFTNVLIKSVTAAEEAQLAHDELFTSVERMAKRYKSTAGKSVAEVTADIEESTQALIKASEQMEQTGHDAETLQKGWGKLAATGALDPQQILAQRDAFSDVLSYINGANATAEESAAPRRAMGGCDPARQPRAKQTDGPLHRGDRAREECHEAREKGRDLRRRGH